MPIIKAHRLPGMPNAVPIELIDNDWALHIHAKPACALAISGGMSPAEIVLNIERLPLSDLHTLDANRVAAIIKSKGVYINDTI